MSNRSAERLKDLSEEVVVEAIHRYVSREFVKQQIVCCGVQEKRRKKLRSVLVIFFILYQCLFRDSNRREVLQKLVEGYRTRGWKIPQKTLATRSALCKALKRVGSKVLQKSYEAFVLNQKPCEESFYHGMRLKAYDSSGFNCEDSTENRKTYGKPSSREGECAWPQLKLVMEMDLGTRQPGRIAYGGYRSDEIQMVHQLLSEAQEGELYLLDRGLECFKNMKKIQDRKAQFLARLPKCRKVKPIKPLKDGSWWGLIQDELSGETMRVRVIEFRIANPLRANPREVQRLVTSLRDEGLYPALELIALYHQRWEIEISFDELKTHLFDRPRSESFFRSQRAEGVLQELYGLLIIYSVIRSIMQEAAAKYDLDPRRLSFTACVQVLRRAVVRMQAARSELLIGMYEDLLNEMAGSLLPQRENRINPRVVKKRRKKFPSKGKGPYPTKPLKTTFMEDVQMVVTHV